MSKKTNSNTLWILTAILILALGGGLYYLKKQGQPVINNHMQLQPPARTLQQKPQFDFYNVLPASANNTPPAAPSSPKPVSQKPPPLAKNQPAKVSNTQVTAENYYLQIASLTKYEDADALKANLILQGYNTAVTKVTVGNNTRYRVTVGPYTNLAKAQSDQAALRNNKTNSLLIKQKSGPGHLP